MAPSVDVARLTESLYECYNGSTLIYGIVTVTARTVKDPRVKESKVKVALIYLPVYACKYIGLCKYSSTTIKTYKNRYKKQQHRTRRLQDLDLKVIYR